MTAMRFSTLTAALRPFSTVILTAILIPLAVFTYNTWRDSRHLEAQRQVRIMELETQISGRLIQWERYGLANSARYQGHFNDLLDLLIPHLEGASTGGPIQRIVPTLA